MRTFFFTLCSLAIFGQDVTYWVHPGVPMKPVLESAKKTFSAFGLNLVLGESAQSSAVYIGFVPFIGSEQAMLLKGPVLEVTLFAPTANEVDVSEGEESEVIEGENQTMVIGLLSRDSNLVTQLFSSDEGGLFFSDAYTGVPVELKPFDRVRDLKLAIEQKKVEFLLCSNASQVLLNAQIEGMASQETWSVEMGVFLGRSVQGSLTLSRLLIQSLHQSLDIVEKDVRTEIAATMRLTKTEQDAALAFWAEGWDSLWSAPVHDQVPCLSSAYEKGRSIIPSKRSAVSFSITRPGNNQ